MIEHRPITHDGHVSSVLRDMIAGTYDMRELTTRQKYELLLKLWKLYRCMQDIGWDEHTCDWDWYVGIETVNETIGGKLFGDAQFANVTDADDYFLDDMICDSFTVSPETPPHTVSDDPYDDSRITLHIDFEDDHKDLGFWIRDVASITIAER